MGVYGGGVIRPLWYSTRSGVLLPCDMPQGTMGGGGRWVTMVLLCSALCSALFSCTSVSIYSKHILVTPVLAGDSTHTLSSSSGNLPVLVTVHYIHNGRWWQVGMIGLLWCLIVSALVNLALSIGFSQHTLTNGLESCGGCCTARKLCSDLSHVMM